jgi:hypothetical protein
MKTNRVRLSDAYQAALRLTENRKMMATAKATDIKEHAHDPAQRSPKDHVAVWTSEAIARRPLR